MFLRQLSVALVSYVHASCALLVCRLPRQPCGGSGSPPVLLHRLVHQRRLHLPLLQAAPGEGGAHSALDEFVDVYCTMLYCTLLYRSVLYCTSLMHAGMQGEYKAEKEGWEWEREKPAVRMARQRWELPAQSSITTLEQGEALKKEAFLALCPLRVLADHPH